MQLFWCTTDDHDEDWFVVAPSAGAASEYFEDAEGYGPGDAAADWVAEVPVGVDVGLEAGAHARWADEDLLVACGGEQLPYKPDLSPEAAALRTVMGVVVGAWRFNGRTYASGDITLEHRSSTVDN